MNIELAIISIVILIFSAILHEVSHGYVAERLGDPTARLLGRLTLDPRPHIDLWMSIILPLILFFTSPIIIGGAKPVPVDPFNLRDGKKDMALVSLAGPMMNFLIAVVFALIIKLLGPIINESIILVILYKVVQLNLLLGIFNLLPIPPLDGSKVFAMLLPDSTAKSYLSLGSMGMFIIFFLLLFPIGGFSLGSLISNLLGFSLNLLGL